MRITLYNFYIVEIWGDFMTVPGWLILNVYVLMLTGTMLYFSVREKRQTKQNKSFIRLQGVNLFLLY